MQRDPCGVSESSSARLDHAGLDFLQLGMSSAYLVSAHKWFNLAAMRGNTDAIRLRREIAAEMTTAEIITAQRAARAWITRH